MIKLLSTSEKAIPKDNLTFLGNMKGDDLIPYRGPDYWTGYPYIEWSKFEKKIIDQYYAWNPKPLPDLHNQELLLKPEMRATGLVHETRGFAFKREAAESR